LSNIKTEEYIYFDFGNKNPTKADISTIITNMGPSPKITNAHFMQNFSENKNFTMCIVTAPPLFFDILFDKANNKSVCWNLVTNKPKCEPYQFFPFMPRAFNDDYFYSVIDASRALTAKKLLKETEITLNPSHSEYLNYKAILDTDINDNQIIALYKFKRL
jgi:hypothetical protein